MKIKLPFTEKFLWDLFNFKSRVSDIAEEIFPRKYGLPFSDFNIFRDEWTDKNKRKYEKKKNKRKFSELVYRLKKEGYLKVLRIKNESGIMITRKGLDKISKIKVKSINKELRKDGKWQMVLFDIPESQRRSRDLFRSQLKRLGYKGLQKSIWVCPYNTLQETNELIKRYDLEKWVELLLVNKIGLG